MTLFKRPLLFPLIGLILGICLVPYYFFHFSICFLGFALLGISYLFFYRYRFISGIQLSSTLLFLFVGWGIASFSISKVEKNYSFFQWESEQKSYLIGKIDAPCEKKQESTEIVLNLLGIRRNDKTERPSGRLLLKIGNGNCRFQEGDIVQTYTQIKKPDRFRNFGSFDYPFYLRAKNINFSAYVENEDFIVKVGEERNFIQSFTISLRGKTKKSIESLSNLNQRQVLLALLLGNKSELSPEIERIFRQTGTTHLLVVSGFHLTMIGGFFYFFIRSVFSLYPSFLLKLPVRKIAILFSFVFIIVYAAIVGFSSSVLRSFLSAFIALLILLLMRSKDLLSVLILAIFSILLIWPLLLFDISFQLSALSVFSILLLVPRCEKILLNRYPKIFSKYFARSFLQIILSSIAVQIGLFPILISQFHQFSWMSLIANLVLVPIFTFLLMPIGFLGIIFSSLKLSFSVSLFRLAGMILDPFLFFLKSLSSFSFSHSYFTDFYPVQFFLYYSLIIVWFLPLIFTKRLKIFMILFLFNICNWIYFPLSHHFDDSFKISFLDVGQGDSMLLQLPHGKNILVDAGGFAQSSFDSGEQIVLPALFSKKISSLDYIVITHPHPDHYSGVKALLEPFHPKVIWWNGEKSDADSYKELIKEAARLNIPFKKLDQSQPSFEIEGVYFEILYPTSNLFSANLLKGGEVNNHSLVLKLEYKNLNLLLAGDIQKETEEILTRSGKLDSIDILKVPHHGSNTSSQLSFLCRLKPQIGLMGIGRRNWFKFPHPPVLARYQAIGTEIFRTDEDGEIDLIWDGKKLLLSTFMGREQELHLRSPNLADASLKDVCKGSSSEF